MEDLPPLPEPGSLRAGWTHPTVYTVADMRDYATAAIQRERTRCICAIERLRDEHCALSTDPPHDALEHCDPAGGCELVDAWNEAIRVIREGM